MFSRGSFCGLWCCFQQNEPMKQFKKNRKEACSELGDEAGFFIIIRWSGFLSFCVKQVLFFRDPILQIVCRDCSPPYISPTVARCLTSWFEAWKRAFLNAIRRFTGEGHRLWFALQPQYSWAQKVSWRSTKIIQNSAIRPSAILQNLLAKKVTYIYIYSHVFWFPWNLWTGAQNVGSCSWLILNVETGWMAVYIYKIL